MTERRGTPAQQRAARAARAVRQAAEDRAVWTEARAAEVRAASTGGRLRSPRALVAARIGRWPSRVVAGSGAGPAAVEHAAGVWTDALTGLGWRADRLWEAVGEGPDRAGRFGGQVDLAFLAALARHLDGCSKCWLEWHGGGKPVELLTRAVRARPVLASVYGVITREAAARSRGEIRLVP